MKYTLYIFAMLFIFSCKPLPQKNNSTEISTENINKIEKSEAEWKNELSKDEFCVIREKGTERAFTGKYLHNKENGTYKCKACGLELFDSSTKYDSGSGWPSFYDLINADNIHKETDNKLGYSRTELTCSRCGAHLGHVFDDGPKPTGLRYCINSVSLDFVKNKK